MLRRTIQMWEEGKGEIDPIFKSVPQHHNGTSGNATQFQKYKLGRN